MNKWPVTLREITRLQIELTSLCNAQCPSCERASYKEFDDDVYKKSITKKNQLSFDTIKAILNNDFDNLFSVHFCGNVDEPTLHDDFLEICKYVSENTDPETMINVSTNGGTRNKEFWKEFAKIKKVNCIFGIDGLEDTNHIYRKNVRWKKLEENYKTFIEFGGKASWQFIVFDHNKHQIENARKKSKDEGFIIFQTKYSGRDNSEVKSVPFEKKMNSCIKCKATYHNDDLEKSFFIDSASNVWPCCWIATAEHRREFSKKIGYKFGNYLCNNLKYNTIKEIVESDMFGYLYENLDKMSVCQMKCKENRVDKNIIETDDKKVLEHFEKRKIKLGLHNNGKM